MSEQTTEHKIQFLYEAISDAQETIRFFDSKTAVAITVVSAYFIGLLIAAENLVEYWDFYSFLFTSLLFINLLGLTICVIIIKRIIRPTENPKDNIVLNGAFLPDLNFYLASNEYKWWFAFSNSTKHKLKYKYNDYLDNLNAVDSIGIINSLSFELLKVSFIRNIKTDRFKILVRMLIATSFLVTVTYGFYVVETHKAKYIIEMQKRSALTIKEIQEKSAETIKEMRKQSAERILQID